MHNNSQFCGYKSPLKSFQHHSFLISSACDWLHIFSIILIISCLLLLHNTSLLVREVVYMHHSADRYAKSERWSMWYMRRIVQLIDMQWISQAFVHAELRHTKSWSTKSQKTITVSQYFAKEAGGIWNRSLTR